VNFGLAVIAGRLLGPRGLGVVFIGFVAYQLASGLQRGIITQPLIAHAAPLGAAERRRLIQSALTVVVLSAGALSVLLGLAGFLASGDFGRGLLLFAPWLVPALLQEFWKAVLFQEGKERAAAFCDATRLAIMALAVPIVLSYRSDYLIVGVWGVAAAIGFVLALGAMRTSLGRPRAAFIWLVRDAWALGRWLGTREMVYQVGTYLTVVALALIIGSRNLGGLRAAEALFSPFSLIAAAFVLPALPALSRELAISRRAAIRLTFRISAAAVALGATYFLVMAEVGQWLLVKLFGDSFAQFDGLIWPMATTQLLAAVSFAFLVLLIAEKRGGALVAAAVAGTTATFLSAAALGALAGVQGAAWGYAIGAAASALFVVVALQSPRTRRGRGEGPTSSAGR
jgi:O-antigen/teichoic acid export membrane protein